MDRNIKALAVMVGLIGCGTWYAMGIEDRANVAGAIPAAPATRADPWPVTPDGKVEMRAFSRTLALPSCEACQEEVRIQTFTASGGPHDDAWFDAKMRDAMANPGPLRRALVKAERVTIHAARTRAGTLLGNPEPNGIVRLTVTLYQTPLSRDDCDSGRSGPLAPLPCGFLIGKASETASADAAGFVAATTFPFAGPGDTMYVTTDEALRGPLGVPPYVWCRKGMPTCETTWNIYSSGSSYHPTTTMEVAFQVDRRTVPEDGWLALFGTARRIAESIVAE